MPIFRMEGIVSGPKEVYLVGTDQSFVFSKKIGLVRDLGFVLKSIKLSGLCYYNN